MNHFVSPRFYEAIVPPRLKKHSELVVQASGVAELAGGAGGAHARRTPSGRAAADRACSLAVFPANIHMAREPERFKSIPRWALYARLPLQPLVMWWAWRATRP